MNKKGERFWKSMFKKNNFSHNISAVPPGPYQLRFVDFISRNVLKPGLEQSQGEEDTGRNPKKQFIRKLKDTNFLKV